MNLKYLTEHLSCFNYSKGENPLIEIVKAEQKKRGEYIPENNLILYVFAGKGEFAYDGLESVIVKSGELLFVPVGRELTYNIPAGFTGVLFRLEDEIRLCDCFHLEALTNELKEEVTDHIYTVEANSAVTSFMNATRYFVEAKLLCRSFLDLKVKELLYLLRAFYLKSELARLFHPALDNNTFSAGVFRYYRRSNSVSELAGFLNYTVSGFEKRFKKTFGTPPSKWLREKKSQQIYRDVSLGILNFKEIADKYGFSSTSTFNDFYKLTFGETPGSVRKKSKEGRK